MKQAITDIKKDSRVIEIIERKDSEDTDDIGYAVIIFHSARGIGVMIYDNDAEDDLGIVLAFKTFAEAKAYAEKC